MIRASRGPNKNMLSTNSTDGPTRPQVDLTEIDEAMLWLRDELGRKGTPLAGVFWRGDRLVHVPIEGEQGYEPLTEAVDESDGPAQIRSINPHYIVGQITYRYAAYRRQMYRGEEVRRKDGSPQTKKTVFSLQSAQTVLAALEAPNARVLRGVTHTPLHRPDGTLITEPGYDDATGLMYLPDPHLMIPAVSKDPTSDDVMNASELIHEMLDDFPFVTNSDRTNYIGALITPLLRNLAKPSYKMFAVEAHQPSSGKTLLAKVMQGIHSGVFRSEMPEDEAEIRKQITSILTQTTGASVVIDNVAGVLKSSALAGLLTSKTWTDRELGSKDYVSAPNDRVWMITGNNLHIGGDLPRRTIRVAIDPGCPNPEDRTGFAIKDLEAWVDDRRGDLIHALLTLIQSWVVAGMHKADESSSDSFAHWTETVRGILQHCGIAGIFDGPDTKVKAGGAEEDWDIFLRAAFESFGNQPWTTKQLLERVESMTEANPIPIDALPGDIGEKAARASTGAKSQTKTLGRWVANRIGRWGGGLCIREAGDSNGTKSARLWYIQTQPTRTTAPATTQTAPVETSKEQPAFNGVKNHNGDPMQARPLPGEIPATVMPPQQAANGNRESQPSKQRE